jgi:hypothetical protein
MTVNRASVIVAAIVLGAAGCGGAAQSRRGAPETTPVGSATYSLKAVQRCLTRHAVSEYAERAVAKPAYKKLLPPGITGVLTGFRSAGSGLFGLHSTFDSGLLFFFKNAALARAGESKLADAFVYARGLPKVAAQLVHAFGVPTAAAARQLYGVAGNTVIIWEYPRLHAASSSRILNGCLATNPK